MSNRLYRTGIVCLASAVGAMPHVSSRDRGSRLKTAVNVTPWAGHGSWKPSGKLIAFQLISLGHVAFRQANRETIDSFHQPMKNATSARILQPPKKTAPIAIDRRCRGFATYRDDFSDFINRSRSCFLDIRPRHVRDTRSASNAINEKKAKRANAPPRIIGPHHSATLSLVIFPASTGKNNITASDKKQTNESP